MIAGYSFTVTGKTTEEALRSQIVPNGDEIFPSEEAMRGVLDAKVQKLMNLRVFSKVEYTATYTNESRGIRFYQIRFTVVDASSILPFPYGKYDSNSGLRLGMKLYNRNVFGQLANLYLSGNVTLPDSVFQQGLSSSWGKSVYYGEVDLSQLPLGKQVRLNLASQFSYDTSNPTDVTSSYFYFDINPQNMTIDHKALTLNTWFKMYPATTDIRGKWTYYRIGNEINWGPFALSLGGFSFYNKMIAYAPGTDDYYFYSLSHFRYHGLRIKGQQIDTRVSMETNGKYGVLSWLDISGTMGTGFSLFGWARWYNEVSIHNKMYPDPLLYELFFEVNSTLTRSTINWKGNFRTGMDFKFHGDVNWFPRHMYEERPYTDDDSAWLESMFTWFPFATSWINPSVRLTGVISSQDKEFLPDATSTYISDYIRGIRDSNDFLEKNGSKRNSWTTAVVLNCNLTTSFITFRNFAHTYAIPFLDIALVNDANGLNGGKDKWLVGAGMEGVVVFDRYPAYPIRASLGFNMEDVYHKLKGIGDGSVEYELYIGLYFFY